MPKKRMPGPLKKTDPSKERPPSDKELANEAQLADPTEDQGKQAFRVPPWNQTPASKSKRPKSAKAL